ncbi:MAG: hypothetical protein NHB14_13325 [Desulfosporosinus sp.]|nr:hypothetical protein [Desulfosporosinus sp.]
MHPFEITQKDKKGNVISSKVSDINEQFRPDISMDKLAKLKPIFGNPTCTAGNAPGMNDGAAAQIITTRENAGGYAACAICGGLTQGAGAIIWVE